MIHLAAAFDSFGLGQVELQTACAVPGSRLFFAHVSVRLDLTQDSRERRDAGQRGSPPDSGQPHITPTKPFEDDDEDDYDYDPLASEARSTAFPQASAIHHRHHLGRIPFAGDFYLAEESVCLLQIFRG